MSTVLERGDLFFDRPRVDLDARLGATELPTEPLEQGTWR